MRAAPSLLAAVVVLAVSGCSSGPTTFDQTARDFMAYDACKDAVKNQLKAPGSADFQGSTDVDYRTTGGDNIMVSGWVDAQNSFGAKLRSTFTCSMDVSKDGTASAVQATVDGQ